MAAEVEDVDIIVGGHSHTFLFSGEQPPSIEVPSGPYPTYVTNSFGKVVPVVQVYCYTKYLGHLELNFDQQVIYRTRARFTRGLYFIYVL